MKDIIKEILAADEKARNKLAKSKEEKENIPVNVSKKKALINEHYMEEAHVKLEEHKQELNKKLNDHREKLQAQFEQTTKELSTQFNTNKERWIQTIYDRCIHQ